VTRPSVTFCAYDRLGGVGGPFGWAVDFATYLHAHGFSIRALILCRGGLEASSIAQAYRRVGIAVDVLDTTYAPPLELEVEWILQKWKEHPTNCFIANLVLPALYASSWLRSAGAHTIGVIHSDPQHDAFYADVLRTFVGGALNSRLNTVVGVSKRISDQVKVASQGTVNVSTIACGTHTPTERASRPVGVLKLIYSGRLVQHQKRIHEVIGALIEATAVEGIEGTICGDGPEREWVERAIDGRPGIYYIGPVPQREMFSVYAQHHVVVLLSDFEGLPMSVVEAMSCGLVPVCLDEESGVREIVTNGVNGIIVSNRDGEFVEAITYLRDGNAWKQLSDEALKTISSRYSHDVVFQRWNDLLSSVDHGSRLIVDAVPNKIDLRGVRPPDLFKGYPACRPPARTVIVQRLNGVWARIRQAIRPRSRLRKLASIATRADRRTWDQ
jgi:glycosyltransferase involved in cell wall biosynthesis